MNPPQREEEEVDLDKVLASVKQVHVDGLLRTKNDIVHHHIRPIFKAQSFEEMVKAVHNSRFKFEQLGLFKSAKVFIDVSKSHPDDPHGYDISFKVKEQRRFRGELNTSVGTNEGTVLGCLSMPNTFGRGERVSTEVTYGSKNAVGASLNFAKPLFFEPSFLLQASAFQNSGEFPWSGFKLKNRGVALEFGFPSLLGNHSLRWEGIWRELSCLSPGLTAFAIREESGHSLKSSLKHTWFRDTRDSKVLPSSGYLLKATHEIAGFGGDAKFLKQEAEVQFNKQLIWDSTLQFTFAGGIVTPFWRGASHRVSVADRFFIGGPLTLRGFNFKGVGPRVDGCSLGATAYWCSGLHLYTPLPFRPGKGGFGEYFRTHFFVNTGNLGNYDSGISAEENVRGLLNGVRVSYGVGIAVRLGHMARVEVNYCVPVRAQASDSVNPGLQVGVGVSFL